MNTIQEQWETFERMVIPKDAPDIQRVEMRKSFYAGVQAMLNIQWNVGDESISEDAGVAILEGIWQECEMFLKEIK